MTNHFTSSIPEYHRSYSTRTNYFTRDTHHKPFRPFNPWHTIYQWTKKVFHPPNVSLQRRDISQSLLFLAMVGIMSLSFRQSFALKLPMNNTTLHLVKSIWISTASGSIHVVVVWFTLLAICCLVCFQPLKELLVVYLIRPLKLNSQTQT